MAEYLKLPEVARRLDISEKTARRMVKGGKLPAVFIGNAYRVSEEDLTTYLRSAQVDPGKVPRRSLSEPSLFNGLEDERRLRYLRGLRALVDGLARRWREQPPQTSREIAPLYEALSAVVEQGVFEPSDVGAAEARELTMLMLGFQRLNDIADKVEENETAEQRRATFALIQEKASA